MYIKRCNVRLRTVELKKWMQWDGYYSHFSFKWCIASVCCFISKLLLHIVCIMLLKIEILLKKWCVKSLKAVKWYDIYNIAQHYKNYSYKSECRFYHLDDVNITIWFLICVCKNVTYFVFLTCRYNVLFSIKQNR